MSGITLTSINSIDIIILIIFLISILVGFSRGLVSEILALLVLIVAFVVAIFFSNELADFFHQTTAVHNAASSASSSSGGDEQHSTISYMLLGVSFGVLFIGTIIIGSIVRMLLHLVVGSSVFGLGNRLLGGLFGFVRGYLINLVLIFLIQLSPFSSQNWWKDSQFVPYFESQIIWLGKVVSPTLANLKQTLDEQMNNRDSKKEGDTKSNTASKDEKK